VLFFAGCNLPRDETSGEHLNRINTASVPIESESVTSRAAQLQPATSRTLLNFGDPGLTVSNSVF